MKTLTIQARLTAWYFLTLAIIVALFAGGSWFAMKRSMYDSVDRDIGHLIRSVGPFIQSHSLQTRDDLSKAFSGSTESPVLGEFVQITDDQSGILYESDLLRSHHVPALPPGNPDGTIKIANGGKGHWPIRVASQHITVAGTGMTIHVVEPLHDLIESLEDYTFYLTFLIPVALLLTTTAGYWISRRALAPVEQIRRQAQAIDPADLASRLRIPPTDDELSRLALTLNAMLSRIETGFRSIEQFTADASHELRAPLALIITAGEVSLRRERTQEELAEVMSKIVSEGRHMSRLIENLLDLARGDARPRHTELMPIDIAAMLRDLCAELAPAAHSKSLTLEAALPDRPVHVLGEATELKRLFVILLDNAIKYTESGSIQLALTADQEFVNISVTDTGIGMAADALPHVFDRFWRADKVRSRAEGGAGLGLSLASQIVKRHSGVISVQSTPGQGSTFTVQLPALPTPQTQL